MFYTAPRYSRPVTSQLVALDLFAGTGWGVACRNLGIEEYGVDNMKEVVATRERNGMTTLFEDVWDGVYDPSQLPEYEILIASPPCQTFSVAGSGAGRRALNEVISLIDEGAYDRYDDLRKFADEQGDERTALVLTPLSYISRDRPLYVVLEQVPTVLPVWERYATELRGWGYSTWTGNLYSEQYGVPQTRKRAVLIARRDGFPAQPPRPTHSRYYPTDSQRRDPGVRNWVSMAEALGWDGGRLRSNYGTGGDPENRGERSSAQPAATVTTKADRNKWFMAAAGTSHQLSDPRPVTVPAATITGVNSAEWGTRATRAAGPRDRDPEGRRLSLAEAAALQSYPEDFVWVGTQRSAFQQIGNAVPPQMAEAILVSMLGRPLHR